jgi:hypothetical protein
VKEKGYRVNHILQNFRYATTLKETRMDTINKKIYFYRLFMKKSGRPVDSIQVFLKIGSLPFANGERYLELKNENSQCIYIEPICSPLRANIG